MYNMYGIRARQVTVPPLLTRWEEDNPSESAMVYFLQNEHRLETYPDHDT